MRALFADTFFWIAILDPADSFHERARLIANERRASVLVTTDEVLTELLAYFATRECCGASARAWQVKGLLSDLNVRVIPQSRQSFLGGLELYLARPDKGYSLTDCISMQTMRREGISESLTNDRHFEQEGFKALFRG